MQISGFFFLAVALLATLTWGGINISGFANSIDNFQTVALPGQHVLYLEEKHYVVYLEDTRQVPPLDAGNFLSLSVKSLGGDAVVPTSKYQALLTYNWGRHHGRAVGTFDPPHAGQYLITTRDPYAVPGEMSVTVGASVATLIAHYGLRGVGGALALFFGLGSIGAALLTSYDRRGRLGNKEQAKKQPGDASL